MKTLRVISLLLSIFLIELSLNSVLALEAGVEMSEQNTPQSEAHIETANCEFELDSIPFTTQLDLGANNPSPKYSGRSSQNTFRLHSRPGSLKTIFLDFDGVFLPDYDRFFPGWSIDNSNDFNAEERAAIYEIWQRVSEDFAPFDVNVTTEYPGAPALIKATHADTRYGVSVVFTDYQSGFCGSCSGVARIGIFNRVPSPFLAQRPPFVFPDILSHNTKAMAEVATHEVGHTLGLHHHGNRFEEYYGGHGQAGPTGWAPIMGNSLTRQLSQWSDGSYFGANNSSQDDLSVIQAHGLDLIADDHGDTIDDATLVPGGGSFSTDGLINTREDIDVIRFWVTGGKTVSIGVDPADEGANLDSKLIAYNSDQRVIRTSNPVHGVSSSISFVAPASGWFYLSVDGTHKGIPNNNYSGGYSDYASLGNYSVYVVKEFR